MRVNIYAEEMTDRVEIVEKTTPDGTFTGLRLYLELPASTFKYAVGMPVNKDVSALSEHEVIQIKGPFIHRPGDDDSAAVTFWGKRSLIPVLKKMITELEAHYDKKIVEHREGVYARLAKPKAAR